MLGSIDWKWLIIGGLFALFVLPFLMRLVTSKRKPPAAA